MGVGLDIHIELIVLLDVDKRGCQDRVDCVLQRRLTHFVRVRLEGTRDLLFILNHASLNVRKEAPQFGHIGICKIQQFMDVYVESLPKVAQLDQLVLFNPLFLNYVLHILNPRSLFWLQMGEQVVESQGHAFHLQVLLLVFEIMSDDGLGVDPGEEILLLQQIRVQIVRLAVLILVREGDPDKHQGVTDTPQGHIVAHQLAGIDTRLIERHFEPPSDKFVAHVEYFKQRPPIDIDLLDPILVQIHSLQLEHHDRVPVGRHVVQSLVFRDQTDVRPVVVGVAVVVRQQSRLYHDLALLKQAVGDSACFVFQREVDHPIEVDLKALRRVVLFFKLIAINGLLHSLPDILDHLLVVVVETALGVGLTEFLVPLFLHDPFDLHSAFLNFLYLLLLLLIERVAGGQLTQRPFGIRFLGN